MKTITIKKTHPKAQYIEANCSCAGPHANITGMKKLYWGKDAYVVKIGTYIYKVSQELYNQL